MASPFRLFRKHVKPLLAVFVVLLMLSWVIGDSLMGYLRGPSGGAERRGPQAPNAVAVRWDGGSLTNQELANLVMRRRLVNAFVGAIEAGGAQAALEAGVEPRPLRVARVAGVETPEQGVEQDVVLTRIFADMAREAGMRISDEAIVAYLDELGRQHVSRDDMRSIIQRMQVGGVRASIDYILDALRDELLARNYLSSYHFSFFTVTPEERWADWLKANDRVAIEAVAFPAETFLVDVAEPTDAELEAFFERKDENGTPYRERVPQPDFKENTELPSPYPGFAVPRRIDAQFIKADYDKFLTKVENEITDEEIEKFYEENKDPLFIKAASLLIDESPKSEEPAGEEESGASDAAATDSEATTDTADGGSAGSSSAPDEGGEAAPAPADATAPSAVEVEGAAEESEATEPSPSDQSFDRALGRVSQFHLTALLQEPPAPADESAGEESDASAGADEAKATEAVEPATSADESTDASTASEATPPTAEPAEKPKEFQPLDEVRDEIRRDLAAQRVTQQLIDLMTKLKGELDAEFTKYFASALDAQTDDEEPATLPPPTGVLADLKSLAEKHGLEYGTTGPVSMLEMRETQVGKSIDAEYQLPLWQVLFGSKDLEMYQPLASVDIEGNRYLSMKTSDTERRVPTLDEVRDEVVRAWKLQEAAKIAEQEAAKAAQKVEDSGSTLSDYFAEDPSVTVIRTDPFAWLTGGEVSRITGQPQPFRLSEPDGIVAAGPDFMEEVFELGDGQVGAVFNNDHSIAYVVRVSDHELTPEELRTAYLAEANSWPGLLAMTSTRSRQAIRALLDDVRESTHLTWERPADQIDEAEAE